MKKGFISIYVLLLLLILSVSIAFINDQSKNNHEIKSSLLDKKQATYDAESSINIYLKEEKESLLTYINNDFGRDISTLSEEKIANLKEDSVYYKNNNRKIYLTRVKDFYRDDLIDANTKIYRVYNESVYKSSLGEARAYISASINPILLQKKPISYYENKEYIDKLGISDYEILDNKAFNKKKEYGPCVIVDGDIKLKKNINIKGILIVKGNIDINGKSLTVDGLLACNGYSQDKLTYTNDYELFKDNIGNLDSKYSLQIISKQAY